MEEYAAYGRNGFPGGIRARYLIPILPMFGYLVATSLVIMFKRYRKSLLVFAIVCLVLMTQGGGIVTYLLTTPDNLEWQSEHVHQINRGLEKVTHPLVKE
jgi:hypothetical protein